jgi:hypothetical protein
MPCNFEVNLITRLGVIALFHHFLAHLTQREGNNFKMGTQINFKITG